MKLHTALIAFLIIFFGLIHDTAFAAIESCEATVQPTTANRNTSVALTFSVTNQGSASARWIRIAAPNANFTVTGYSVQNWSALMSSSNLTISGGSLAPDGSVQVQLDVTTADAEDTSGEAWLVTMSDEDGGGNATECSGDTGVTITGAAADTQGPVISDIVVSDVIDSSVKITWTTNEAGDSYVEYGLDESYGSTKSDSTQSTSHSLTLTGLSANTTYNYNLKSTDSSSNVGESGNNTFVTAKSGSTGSTQTGTTTTVTRVVTPTPTATPIPDRTPPSVTLAQKLKSSYQNAPELTGTLRDSSGVSSAGISLDGGKNWSPLQLEAPGKSVTSFSYVPHMLLDDNYDVRVMATDEVGNRGVTPLGILVIDRLPPTIGVSYFSSEFLTVLPDEYGMTTIGIGMNTKITLSASGGPTEIILHVMTDSLQSAIAPIPLVRNPQSGLWSGTISALQAGMYQVSARAVDGTGATSEKTVGKLRVAESGKVTIYDKHTSVPGAAISVYRKDQVLGNFVLWDGTQFGLTNPVLTDQTGAYALFLPAGTYFLRGSASGYSIGETSIFTVPKNQLIRADIFLLPEKVMNVFGKRIPFSWFGRTLTRVQSTVGMNSGRYDSPLIGKPLPQFVLPTTGGGFLTDMDFRGKPMVLTVGAAWYPDMVSQIRMLESGMKESRHTAVILPGQTAIETQMMERRLNSPVQFISDPDGIVVESLGVSAIPMHMAIDRTGIVRQVFVGNLSHEQLDELFQKLL